MRREILTGAHLNNLPVVPVVYAPRNLQTVAVQVTPDTIGAMAIEFGCEVQVGGNVGHLWLTTLLERTNDKGDKVPVEKVIRLGDWLVELQNEIHIFPPDVFNRTFSDLQDLHAFSDEVGLGIVPSETLAKELGIELAPEKKHKIEFLNLPPGMTSPDDPNYQQQLPDQPA